MNYEEMKKSTHHGFNTWNNRSILSYVHLPDAFSLSLGFKDYSTGIHNHEILIGRFEELAEKVTPSFHAFDGSYMELDMQWRDNRFHITASCLETEAYVLVEPVIASVRTPVLSIEAGILWGREGYVNEENGILTGHTPEGTVQVFHTGSRVTDPIIHTQSKYHCVLLDQTIGISVGKACSVQEIRRIIQQQREKFLAEYDRFGQDAETVKAMQSCLAWDTIYDPVKDRIVSPVSRLWSNDAGGCVLFCWDTYFAALMAMGAGNRELAYSNAIEITREKTEAGFVPNFAHSTGFKSRDRSQPPVGSYVVRRIYEKYQEKWFLEEIFQDLYLWNRWWFAHRQIESGLFAWGSDPYQPQVGNYWENHLTNCLEGAALESGLDNSPMYDGMAFDRQTHRMQLADVGLTSLVLLDCQNLAEIAAILGKSQEQKELLDSIASIKKSMEKLWDEENGFYYNYDYSKKAFSRRISPTNFYALYNEDLPRERVSRIVREHFYNPEEFWGDYILPSAPRNDPAFPDNTYWRGRIWAPMNILAYIGLKRHSESQEAARDLAIKSRDLILKEWLAHGHVHENYNSVTGEGCDVGNSDKFYHWGGLLSFVYLEEFGRI